MGVRMCYCGNVLGKPIFQGQSPESQLKEIAKLLGPPPNTFSSKAILNIVVICILQDYSIVV